MSKKNTKKQKGLSMVELLATVAILVSTIMVLLVMGDRAVRQAGFFSAQTQAVFLAKEGMEIVTDEIGSMVTEDYIVSYNQEAQTHANCSTQKLKITNGYYNYGDGDVSPFSRCVFVEGGDDKKVTVTVFFNYQGEQKVELYRVFYLD